MTDIRPEQVINMTERGDHLRFVEIITRGGIIRVNTNLVGVHDSREHVLVEIEPSTWIKPTSGDTSPWDAKVLDRGDRIDVTLIRKEAW